MHPHRPLLFFLSVTLFFPCKAATVQEKALAPVLENTKKPAAAPSVYTNIGGIPVARSAYAQQMIKKYITQYTSSFGAKELYATLDEGEQYRLYVRQELQKRRMPSALEYLPVVESNYKPLAKSKSGARGIWQFMENSIAGFLKKNEWIDERLDPWLSTDAALTKLQDNYRMFGDWPLAIAAYNCGAGAMRRILKKAPQKTFWYIAEHGLLRDQSVQYVPKLLAISELATHATAYALVLPEESTHFADFDYIVLSRQIFLDRLESELRMGSGALAALNPALIKQCTPPEQDYALRLPAGMELSAHIAVNAIRDAEQARALVAHTVAKGDTLYALARTYKTTVAEICKESGIQQNEVLSIGKVLYIPVESAENN